MKHGEMLLLSLNLGVGQGTKVMGARGMTYKGEK